MLITAGWYSGKETGTKLSEQILCRFPIPGARVKDVTLGVAKAQSGGGMEADWTGRALGFVILLITNDQDTFW
jgi:hypothetical protein